MRKAVFLDRDDTILDNAAATAHTPTPGDLLDPALVRLLPGAAGALHDLAEAGYAIVVVTNQGGVAQGLGTLRDVEAVNDRMRALLAEAGVRLDGVYYSPARPPPAGFVPGFTVDAAGWRKPAPGMILAAARELGIDLPASWMVGDAARDVDSGIAAGIPAVRCLRIGADGAFPGLASAAAHVLTVDRAAT